MARRVRAPSAELDDDDALRQAYAAHGPELFRFALRALGDRGHAEDVVQEAFVRAWRGRVGFDPSLASLRVWLFAIARNVVADHMRREQSRPKVRELNPVGGAEIAAAQPDASERLVRGWVVDEALGRIGTDHRHAIVETYLRDRPYAEVAQELGIPVPTLRTRVFYALRAMRAAMDEMEVT